MIDSENLFKEYTFEQLVLMRNEAQKIYSSHPGTVEHPQVYNASFHYLEKTLQAEIESRLRQLAKPIMDQAVEARKKDMDRWAQQIKKQVFRDYTAQNDTDAKK